MANRTFAQINCSILGSRKIDVLTHVEKWAYMCVHLSRFSTYSGVFNYPLVMWQRDANLIADQLSEAIRRLVEVGLIEWEPEEEVVRIVDFHRQRPPQNASQSTKLVSDFLEMLRRQNTSAGIVLRTAVEFVVAAMERSRGWKAGSPEHEKLRDTLRPFLNDMLQEHEETLFTATAGARNGWKADREGNPLALPSTRHH